ncbi:phosphatidylinositol-specific phospholipase C domain-containing protein [Streptomyces sp. NPDC051569]|uniref:phosphatidylinositol-specific phospholipase C domain-containing protein n=1 Tax=Streptomyces sp. NPDC051569 TaxID=3365661 RepID=UPI0037B94D0A
MAKLLRNTMVAGAAAVLALVTTSAQAVDTNQLPYSSTTGVGVHNSYDKAAFTYFADALDSGAGMLELDVWTNVFGSSWRVSHDNPLGNNNNCANATSVSQLRTNAQNRDLAGCLTDIRTWHDANPGHRPIVLKVEMKDGFLQSSGRGPAAFDALLTSKLGNALFRPADLVGSRANLDEASQAGAWPSRAQMAGKFIVELIPGTVEEQNPLDSLWTDKEYATYLRDLKAAGRLGEASAFPAVHNVAAGDPRTRYTDASIRPWFVFFDGDASAWVANGIDTAWYDQRHYFTLMTDAQNVAPAIDGTNPTEQQARDRLNLLAQRNASLISADWRSLPSVLSAVVPRGTAGN